MVRRCTLGVFDALLTAVGFPFDPACKRHDFGYRNFKAQVRFTESNKLRIDDNLRKEFVPLSRSSAVPLPPPQNTDKTATYISSLYHQCSTEYAKSACEALADVYYYAVRMFGRVAVASLAEADIADEDAQAYADAKARYDALVKEAQAKGELPAVQ